MKRLIWSFGLAIVLRVVSWCSPPLLTDSKPKDPSKFKHDGGINDLDAIGNRNVGCGRGVGNWYSVEGQINMGRQYADQIDSTPS